MNTHIRNLAWLPGLMLAATLPGVAAADADEHAQRHAPTVVVGMLAVDPTRDDRVDQTAGTHPTDVHDHTDAAAHADVQTETTMRARMGADDRDQTADEARKEARVQTTISLNRNLRRSDIHVTVDGDTAVLEGTVDDDLHKEFAEELALNVEGIDRVENNLEVDEEYAGPARDDDRRTFAQTVEDATTTTAVRSRLLWSRHADGVNTEVETRDGHVTLSGTAESEEAKQMAESLARNAWGVTSVTNNIVVDPEHRTAGTETDEERTAAMRDTTAAPRTDRTDTDARVTARTDADADDDTGGAISDAWITTKVRSSFLTSRWISSTDIDIETNEGVVVLSGELDSAAERDLAIEVAENIRGVRNVDARNLTVVS